MNSLYDVQQLLKRFGIFIYTGNRLGDLELMETEVKELYKKSCIESKTYQTAQLLLNQEANRIKD